MLTQLGILFLTTNRVETFDAAFQSRIQIALKYGELTIEAKLAIWKLFIGRVEAAQSKDGKASKLPYLSKDEYEMLARKDLNGRQIKSAVMTGKCLEHYLGIQ